MRRFVLGDSHGAHKALEQCFARSNFNFEEDELICLGDVADGWPEPHKIFDLLMKVKNLRFIIGNHDVWLRDRYFNEPLDITSDPHKMEIFHRGWLTQGGRASYRAYENEVDDETKAKHKKFLNEALEYYIDEESNTLFVHGGYLYKYPFEYTANSDDPRIRKELWWDRTLWHKADDLQRLIDNGYSVRKDTQKVGGQFDRIIVGHTSLYHLFEANNDLDNIKPVRSCNVINMDTGGGYNGKVSFMNIDNEEEIYQSDRCHLLYPHVIGR